MHMFVSGIDYGSVSKIIILYFETVLTVWYFWFFIKLILITILKEYLFVWINVTIHKKYEQLL